MQMRFRPRQKFDRNGAFQQEILVENERVFTKIEKKSGQMNKINKRKSASTARKDICKNAYFHLRQYCAEIKQWLKPF